MNYWFIALLMLYSADLGIIMSRNGQPREDNYNFFISLIANIIEVVLIYFAIKTGF